MASVLRLTLTWCNLTLLLSLIQVLAISFSVSASACLIIMFWFSNTTAKLKNRNDTSAIQAAHTTSTPRIGGLAIVLGLVVASLIVFLSDTVSTHAALMLSALPVFVVGLAEDLGRLASPRSRLMAAAVSGALFILLMGQWLPRTDIPVLDLAILWTPFAVSLSLFLSVGQSRIQSNRWLEWPRSHYSSGCIFGPRTNCAPSWTIRAQKLLVHLKCCNCWIFSA